MTSPGWTINLGWIEHFVARIFALGMITLLCLMVVVFDAFAIAGIVKAIRFLIDRRIPQTFRGIKQAVGSSVQYVVLGMAGVYLSVLSILSWKYDDYTTPQPKLTVFWNFFGGLAFILIISLGLVFLKSAYLKWYSILEFACGLLIAVTVLRSLGPNVSWFELTGLISSPYFMVRAIENFRKDRQERKDGTYDNRKMERGAWWLKRRLDLIDLRSYLYAKIVIRWKIRGGP